MNIRFSASSLVALKAAGMIGPKGEAMRALFVLTVAALALSHSPAQAIRPQDVPRPPDGCWVSFAGLVCPTTDAPKQKPKPKPTLVDVVSTPPATSPGVPIPYPN